MTQKEIIEKVKKFQSEYDISEGCATYEEDIKFGVKCFLAGEKEMSSKIEKDPKKQEESKA